MTNCSLVCVGNQFGHDPFDVNVGHFVRVEFRAVTRQVEDLNGIVMIAQPFLGRFAVMNARVIQNQKCLLGSAFDQAAQEISQDARVARSTETLLPHLPLVDDGRDDQQSNTLAADANGRRLAFGRKATPTDIVAAQPGLVAPVDFRPFLLGPCRNLGMRRVHPALHHCRQLFVGTSDRPLWGKPPAFQTGCPSSAPE